MFKLEYFYGKEFNSSSCPEMHAYQNQININQKERAITYRTKFPTVFFH
jgi:hypothetical protein